MVRRLRMRVRRLRRTDPLAGHRGTRQAREQEQHGQRHRMNQPIHVALSITPVIVCSPPTHACALRNRRALTMTDTELNVIAALAIIGLSSNPNTGYSTPAAIGTPRTL